MAIVWIILAGVLSVHSAAGQCPFGRFGPACAYYCHCSPDWRCNDVSGCQGACDSGWRGSTCQQENVARGKSTSSSGTASTSQTSEKAVDGYKNGYNAEFHTWYPRASNAWWRVDLGSQRSVQEVVIYFRTSYKRRRNGLKFYTSTTRPDSSYPSTWGTMCYAVRGLASGANINDTLSIPECRGTWRYLFIYTDTKNAGDPDGPVLDFTEVETYECSRGTYGADCSQFCNGCDSDGCEINGQCISGCANGFYGANCDKSCSLRQCTIQSSTCDPVTGECSSGCKTGWTKTDCTDCANQIYGVQCDKSCTSRQCVVQSSSCERYTGKCEGGCKPGYQEMDCTQPCTFGWYGASCAESCSSRHCSGLSTTCEPGTGLCVEGCLPGYMGTDCAEVCQNGKYGQNCNKSCDDRKCSTASFCPHVTGQCICQPGWNGTDCTQQCPTGTYGYYCSQKCTNRHCLTSAGSCEHVNGACISGCDAGWNGTDCTKVCVLSYGRNCDKYCTDRHCSGSFDCNRNTGKCIDGCQNGWRGEDCSTRCPINTFGPNCLPCGDRHCNDMSDCPGDGTCSGGCQDGWMLDNCTQACPNGTHGHDCNSNCGNCTGIDICDHVTGNCPGDCEPGWRGVLCKQGCHVEKYGINCRKTCGHCNGTCDMETGLCPGGCVDGYNGTYCGTKLTIVLPGAPTDDSYVIPIVAGIIAAVLVIIIIIVVVVVCRKRRKSTHTKNYTAGSLSQGFVNDSSVTSPNKTEVPLPLSPASLRPPPSSPKHVITHGARQDTIPEAEVWWRVGDRLTCNPIVKKGRDGNVYANVEMVSDNVQKTQEKPVVREKPAVREKPKLIQRASKHQPKVVTDPELEEEIIDDEESTSKRDYYNIDDIAVIREIPIGELTATIQKIKSQEGGFEAEYSRLPDGFTALYGDSQKPENAGKNKFRGYYPYDHNRVHLSLLPNVPGSDYINASLMHSYNQKKTYIAAQAPNKKTLGDFWRMIWEHRCGRIIMLTGLVEDMKPKCYQYWPDKDDLQTDHHKVEVDATDIRANYTVRRLKVTSKHNGEYRSVVQYHFTSWPDHGVPDTLALVHFIWMIRQTNTQTDGPLLVHCSAGIGRTGTYIAEDSLLDQARGEGMVDVLGYVSVMRGQRKNMIQTKEQYECVFHCLLEMTKFGNTSMDVENFTTSYSSRGMDSMVDRKTLRELTQMSVNEDRNENTVRNRMWVDGNENFRVRVGPTLRHIRGYLMAVVPPRGLEKLLWKLVEENTVHNVIVISQLQADLVGEKGSRKKCGAVTLTTTGQTNLDSDLSMTTLELQRANSESAQNVKIFKIIGSPTLDSMSSSLLKHVHLQHLSGEITSNVIIHSETDRKCAVSCCIMSNILCGIVEDHRVDVIGQVRTFLKQCPDVTFSENEVRKFLDFAKDFIHTTSNTYANV